MKRTTVFSSVVLGLILCFGVTGCKKNPSKVTHIPGHNRGGLHGTGPSESEPVNPVLGDTPITESEPTPLKGLARWDGRPRDEKALAKERVQFDLDSATIKNSEKSKLDRVAKYLNSNNGNDLIIEGHCDERGTEGYNLSLGEKRALALREYLINTSKIPADRIETISYGETKPIEPLHSEDAFSKNRRGEFVVVLPAK